MPDYEITAPNGKVYEVSGPTPEGAYNALMTMLGNGASNAPAPQQDVSVFDDVTKSLGSGVVRGAIGLAETPELLGRAGIRGYEEIKQLLGGTVESETPIFDTATGRALRGATTLDDYQPQTTYGEYAGTVGEFLPAAIGGPTGLAKRAGVATAAGLGSEAAGQATEGTALEPVARVVGAFATPMALSGVKNKTSQMLAKRAQEKPALQSAKDAQSQAYKDFEAAGGRVSVKMDDVIKRIETKINQDDLFIGYEPRIGGRSNFVDEARQSVIKHAGKDFNLVKLDALKRSLNDTYKASNFDPRVKFIADEIDEIIGTSPNIGSQSAFSLLERARNETRRVKKIEMFEELIDMAERGAAKTGSGGNVVNKYRQAVDKILSQPSRRRQFDKDELELMDKFVRGSMDENVLRLIGKLSPTGNGLMAGLNLYAISMQPAYAAAAITGTLAKGAAEGKAIKSVDQLRKLIESGVAPAKRKLITDRELRILLGLQASEAGE